MFADAAQTALQPMLIYNGEFTLLALGMYLAPNREHSPTVAPRVSCIHRLGYPRLGCRMQGLVFKV